MNKKGKEEIHRKKQELKNVQMLDPNRNPTKHCDVKMAKCSPGVDILFANITLLWPNKVQNTLYCHQT